MLLCLNLMVGAKKKTTNTTKSVKGTSLAISAPRKSKSVESKASVSKKTTTTRPSNRGKKSEENFSEVDSDTRAPKIRIVTRGYMYAVLGVLVLIGIFFAASRLWVVAWVDNKPITKFELYSLLEKRDQGKTTEELVVEKLLVSEGKKQEQVISDAEVEAEIVKIEESQGGKEQLDQILTIQALSREDFRKLVELQLLKQKLFGANTDISDEDVQKYIDENKDSLPTNVMSNPESSEAAELKANVKEQLKQLKINDNFNAWLQQNLQSSRVVKN